MRPDSAASAAARLWSETVSITFTTTRGTGAGSSSAESPSSSSSGGARSASGGRASSQQQRPRQTDEYEYAEYSEYETEQPPEATSEPPVDEETSAPSPTSSRPQQQQREQNEQSAGVGERGSGRRTTGAPPNGQLRIPQPPMVTESLVNVRHDTSCVLRELHVSPAYLTGIDLRADLSWRLDTGTVPALPILAIHTRTFVHTGASVTHFRFLNLVVATCYVL